MVWLRWIGVALSVVIAGMAAVLAYITMSSPGQVFMTEGDWKNFANQDPRHPITEDMRERATALEGQQAPRFVLPGVKESTVSLDELLERGPVVVIATKDECPCSIESQPFFNELAIAYAGRVSFVGLIDMVPKRAYDYQTDFRVPYSLASDPTGNTMRAYDSPQSVYTSVVDANGEIVRQWPGYSAQMLKELDLELAHLTGSQPAGIDTERAPIEPTSGCYFDPDPGK